MRDIKFRAWDELDNNMIYQDYLSASEILNRFDCIMQYTGLKDKNGKEIYEGDIIEMQHCKKCNGLKAIVKRYWDGWWYFTEEETKGRMGEMVSQYVANFDEKFEKLSYCIIIGNKYEDPEMLGGE